MSNHYSTKKFITGLIFGSLAGVAAAMLYAPQSGDDTRRMIRTSALDAKVRAQDGLRTAQEQITTKVGDVQARATGMVQGITDETRSRAQRLKEIGQEVLHEQKDSLQRGASEAQDVIQS